uniref:Uncharacterized protein n=1 Tax=Glossina pallidipes TaxID=7398 RepID=A0A1A9ZEP4_GLOPL
MVSDLSPPSSNSPFEELWPLSELMLRDFFDGGSSLDTISKSDSYVFALFVGNATRSNPILHANHWQDHHQECTLEIVVVVVVVDAGAVAAVDDDETESAWNISDKGRLSARAAANNNDFNHDCITKLDFTRKGSGVLSAADSLDFICFIDLLIDLLID